MPRVTVADGPCEVMCGRVALSGQGGGGTANDGLPVVWRISVEAVVQRDAKRVDVLTKNVDMTRELFKSSSATYLEVISAQSNLLNAQISQVTDDFNKMQAVVSLYSALGGGRE